MVFTIEKSASFAMYSGMLVITNRNELPNYKTELSQMIAINNYEYLIVTQ